LFASLVRAKMVEYAAAVRRACVKTPKIPSKFPDLKALRSIKTTITVISRTGLKSSKSAVMALQHF
jgi:hypothetical protein